MQRFSVREVIEMAVQTERLGQGFYTDMAERFGEDGGLKDLFGRLAAMEADHERTFTGLLAKTTGAEPEGWEEVQPYFRAMAESEFFLGKGKSLDLMRRVDTVVAAVDFAIGFEKETALYYMALKGAVADGETVRRIIKEEINHVLWLTGYKESIRN
jgi:rubrerythrin